MCMLKARIVDHEEETYFRVSKRWLRRMMKINGVSFRRRTTMCWKLPKDSNSCWIFNAFLLENEDIQYSMPDIANADQTPVWFDTSENYTLEENGAKSV